jgi:hypothetical protein
MKGLVSLFGFEEKVGDVRFYYMGPTIKPSEFYLLIVFCVAMIGLSFAFGSKVIMWFSLLLVLMVWLVVDWYYANKALKIMKRVVTGGGIKVDSINLGDVRILEDENEIEWRYGNFKGLIEIKYENKSRS